MNRTLAILAVLLLSLSAMASRPSIPLVDAAPFDTIIDGKKVALYTISNGRVAAQVTNYGAFVVSLFSPDREGKYVNLVSGYDNVQAYTRYNLGLIGPTVGRYANRIANGTFSIDGTEYHITKNNGQHTLHSGLKGFDHVVWDVLKSSRNRLVMQCVSPDGPHGFPGTLTTTVTFLMTKDDGLSVTFEATTDKATPVNMTIHSYFNLNGVDSGNIFDHELSVSADHITEADRQGIPSGNLTAVSGTPYDFNDAARLGDRIMEMPRRGERPQMQEGKVFLYDTNFCLRHSRANTLERVATLYSPQSGRVMEVWNDHPGLQVYTGARRYIALESQMYPDSPNHSNFPNTILRPRQVYRHTCVYKLGVK